MRNMLWRQAKMFFLLLLGYLLQVCVMPYLKVGAITPNMLVACIAVVTVGYGRLRALWAGALYGILLETFLASVPMFNLMLYPITAIFCSVPCADKSESRLQYERSIGKAGRNISPLLRTLICAVLNSVLIEIVSLVYAYLDGAVLSLTAVGRSLTCVLATAVLTALIMIPARRFMGFRKPTPESSPVVRYGKPLKLEDN